MVLRHSTVIFRYFRYHFASKFSTSIRSSIKPVNCRKKKSTSALLTMPKHLTVWVPTNSEKMRIPDQLTCFLRNLYAGQESTVRTGNGTTDWFQIRKGVCQGCILSPWLFNLYAEHTLQNAGLDEAQLESRLPEGISITSDTLMTPPFWQKVKKTKEPLDESERGEWKSWLKTHIQKLKITASSLITSWQIDGKTIETMTYYFLGLQKHCI